MLEEVLATRYVLPLREGGSLPGIVEADDLGTYVLKFRGAGQGLKVLVAEVVVGELARHLGLRVPDLRAVRLDQAIARYEADEEVQDLLTASLGLNLGVDFLPGSFGFDAHHRVEPEEAARVLWLDAFTANVDRTWRNPNLLVWHRNLWCIDHGAALYFHHAWSGGADGPARFAGQPFDVTDHVFASSAEHVRRIDDELAATITPDLVDEVLARVPDDWLEPSRGRTTPTPCARPTARTCSRGSRRPGSGCPRRWRHERRRRGDATPDAPVPVRGAAMRAAHRAGGVRERRRRRPLRARRLPRVRRSSVVPERLRAIDPGIDVEAVESALATIEAVCRGETAAWPSVGDKAGVRFRWLAAPRSTVVQPGPIHGGLTDDPARELAHLLDALVH